MSNKARTTITVDERILKKAKEERINISAVAEIGLIETLKDKKSVLNSENSDSDENKSSNPDSKNSSENEKNDEDGATAGI